MRSFRVLATALCTALLVFAFAGVTLAASKVLLRWQHTVWVPKELEVFTEAVREFERLHPGVQVELTQVPWGDNEPKIKLAAASGAAPDLVMLSPTGVTELSNAGLLADLGELAPKGFFDVFYEAAMKIVTVNGRMMAIPQEGSARAAFYRRDLFEAAGLKGAPTTWDELVEYGKALTRDLNGDGTVDQWGLGFAAGSWEAMENWLPFLWQAGNDIAVQKDGRWCSVMDEKTAQAGMQFYADLVHKYKIVPQAIAGWDWEETMNQFAHGKVAMMLNGMWVVPTLRAQYPSLEGQIETFLYPAGPTGELGVSRGVPLTIGIMKQSKNRKLAWELLEFIYRPGAEGLSVMDRMAIVAGAVNWRKGFEELPYAQDRLLKPFIQAVPRSKAEPLSPQGDTFKMQYANAILQEVVTGKKEPQRALRELHDVFNRLHGCK